MANITAKQRLCKQPAEKRKFSMDFAQLLADSEVITSIASVTSETINGGSSDLTITGTTINGSKIEMFIEDGTSGQTYRVEITVNTNGSQILQGDGILYVSDR
jgi:hypothetical protein